MNKKFAWPPILVLLFVISVTAQNSPKKTLSNDDFGTPSKPKPTNNETADKLRANIRKDIFKKANDDWKTAQSLLLKEFFGEQSKGESGSNCFCFSESETSFFALRNWQIINQDESQLESKYTIRIDASNKGGSPITFLAKAEIIKTKLADFDFCISKIITDDKDKDARKDTITVEKEFLTEAEAAVLAHKSFLSTVGGQTLSTFVNHMNTVLAPDQKFLLREDLPKELVDAQTVLKNARSRWQEYFSTWGDEIDADVRKDYNSVNKYLNYMRSRHDMAIINVKEAEEIIKKYKQK